MTSSEARSPGSLEQEDQDDRIKSYFSLRAVNSWLGPVGGIVQVGLYGRFVDASTLAFVLAIGGLGAFLFLSDLGLGRPLFAILRRRRVEGLGVSRIMSLIVPAWTWISCVLATAMLIVSLALAIAIGPEIPTLAVWAFGVGTGLQSAGGLVRPIFIAVDEHLAFEWMELLRRVGLVVAASLSIWDPSLVASGFTVALVMGATAAWLGARLKGAGRKSSSVSYCPSLRAGRALMSRVGSDSRDMLGFSLAELSLYSGGWLFFPSILDASGVAAYGVFTRLFQGGAVACRLPTDAMVPRWSRTVARQDNQQAWRQLVILGAIGVAVSACLGTTLVLLRNHLEDIWLDGTVALPLLLMLALLSWLVLNGLRHPAGSFLLTTGRHFRVMRSLSAFEAIAVLATFGIVGVWTGNVAYCMALGVLPYATGTSILFLIARKAFRQNE